MSGIDLVRKEIPSDHPYYDEVMRPGLLEQMPARAVGYIWNTIIGKQDFSKNTLGRIIHRAFTGLSHEEREARGQRLTLDDFYRDRGLRE